MRTKRFIWFEKQVKNKGMFSACALLLGIWIIFSRKSENQQFAEFKTFEFTEPTYHKLFGLTLATCLLIVIPTLAHRMIYLLSRSSGHRTNRVQTADFQNPGQVRCRLYEVSVPTISNLPFPNGFTNCRRWVNSLCYF